VVRAVPGDEEREPISNGAAGHGPEEEEDDTLDSEEIAKKIEAALLEAGVLVSSYTAAHPYVALAGAAALGWLLGRTVPARFVGLAGAVALRAAVGSAADQLGRRAARAFGESMSGASEPRKRPPTASA
jgi:hypothetical protein